MSAIKEFNYINKVNFTNVSGAIPPDIYKYFYLFPKPFEELFGKDIITTFYSTKYLFNKLDNFYSMMIDLIEINKGKFNKDVSRNNYRFNNSNFIFFGLLTQYPDDDFNNLFNLSMQSLSSSVLSKINKDEKDFISKFEKIDGIFNCLSNKRNPFFLNFFDDNYNGKDKGFFMTLFEEYNDIRRQILSVSNLKGNAGILSLEPFIKSDVQTDNENNNENNNKKVPNNNQNNFSNSVFFNANQNIYKGLNTRKIINPIIHNSIENIKKELEQIKYELNYFEIEKEKKLKILKKEEINLKLSNPTNVSTITHIKNTIKFIQDDIINIESKINKLKKDIEDKRQEIIDESKGNPIIHNSIRNKKLELEFLINELKNYELDLKKEEIELKKKEIELKKKEEKLKIINHSDPSLSVLINNLKDNIDDLKDEIYYLKNNIIYYLKLDIDNIKKEIEDKRKEIIDESKGIPTNTEKDSSNYSLFYKKNLSNINKEYSNNIRELFKELHEKINDIVLFDRDRDLYEILLTSIKIDYLSLQFFYRFIESVKYKIITDTSIKINSYIYDNIDLYKENLPSFLSWKKKYVNENELKPNSANNSEEIDEEGLVFQKTLEKFFTDWKTQINGPTGIKAQYNQLSKRKKKLTNLQKGVKLVNKSLKRKSLFNRIQNYV